MSTATKEPNWAQTSDTAIWKLGNEGAGLSNIGKQCLDTKLQGSGMKGPAHEHRILAGKLAFYWESKVNTNNILELNTQVNGCEKVGGRCLAAREGRHKLSKQERTGKWVRSGHR